jgi:hypothetical protein
LEELNQHSSAVRTEVFDAQRDPVLQRPGDAAHYSPPRIANPLNVCGFLDRLFGALLTLVITWTVVFGAMRLVARRSGAADAATHTGQ